MRTHPAPSGSVPASKAGTSHATRAERILSALLGTLEAPRFPTTAEVDAVADALGLVWPRATASAVIEAITYAAPHRLLAVELALGLQAARLHEVA